MFTKSRMSVRVSAARVMYREQDRLQKKSKSSFLSTSKVGEVSQESFLNLWFTSYFKWDLQIKLIFSQYVYQIKNVCSSDSVKAELYREPTFYYISCFVYFSILKSSCFAFELEGTKPKKPYLFTEVQLFSSVFLIQCLKIKPSLMLSLSKHVII